MRFIMSISVFECEDCGSLEIKYCNFNQMHYCDCGRVCYQSPMPVSIEVVV